MNQFTYGAMPGVATPIEKAPSACDTEGFDNNTNDSNSATSVSSGKAAASTPEQALLEAIEAAGLTPPDEINSDGEIHRFATNGKHDDDAGWYVLHKAALPYGAFGCWRAGIKTTWCIKSSTEMTQAERDVHQHSIQALRAQQDAEKTKRNESAAIVASARFEAANPCTSHPYLTAKGVKAYGIMQAGDNLLIPLRDSTGSLHSLQTIMPGGSKRFLLGGSVKGCFHGIHGGVEQLIICEGYATGASLHEATGDSVAVAFNAGNLEAVAVAMRTKYPTLKIVIAADDDHQTEGNPGITRARAAALAVGGYLAIPDFGSNRPEKATDFNDLHQLLGLDAVKLGIESAIDSLASIGSNVVSLDQLNDGVADTHRNAPRPDPVCLYGLVGDIAIAGSNNTEANSYAIAAAMLAYLGAAIGRGPYLPIGDDCNHARLFLVHVG